MAEAARWDGVFIQARIHSNVELGIVDGGINGDEHMWADQRDVGDNG